MFTHRLRMLPAVAALGAATAMGGSLPALAASSPDASSSGLGYDILTANGGVHNFGAPWYGSAAGTLGNSTAVGLATDPKTGGYWILKSNGGVANYNAPWYGSPLGSTNSPVTAIAADRGGYLVLTANGGVHNFGAPWYGSAAGKLSSNQKAIGLAVDQQNGGYWILISNGGVQNYNAPWEGSMGNTLGFPPVTAISAA